MADATTKRNVKLGIPVSDRKHHLAREIARVDPKLDGWNTEIFHDHVKRQLKSITMILAEDPSKWQDQFEKQFGSIHCSLIQREPFHQAFRMGSLAVLRFSGEPKATSNQISELFRVLLGPSAANIRSEFKVVRVKSSPARSECDVRARFILNRQESIVQVNSIWQCQFAWTETSQPPRLRQVVVTELEEASARYPMFADVTDHAMANVPSFSQQFEMDIDTWRSLIDWRFGIEAIAPHGIAVGDVDDNGFDDLFVCEPGGLPNKLYLQSPDGALCDRSAEWQVDFIEPTHSALIIDLDNDGDQDLVVASSSYVLFLENHKKRFELRHIEQSNSVARSMCAADYDLDGDLDVFVCGYFSRNESAAGAALGRPMPYHDANNGVPNLLLENRGSFLFQEVADRVGLGENNNRFSYAASWLDYDQDGDSDLYVANDFGRNNLYRNANGRFEDVANAARVEDISAGMSVSCGDFDRDGHMDIYVGNMFSSAGNRIAFQRKFNPRLDSRGRASFQRHARGNSLFRNLADSTFADVSLAAKANMGRWAWSSNFVDINNDGWLDLAIANGMVTNKEDSSDL